MASLLKKIDTWALQGIISNEQAAQIKEYESNQEPNHPWALWGAVVIGLSAVAIGLVSIIAANWHEISGNIKILNYLFMQSLLGYVLWTQREKTGYLREALTLIFCLMFLAGIGLVGQVFHLKSNGYTALYFWCALTLPLTLTSKFRSSPYLWVSILIIATLIWLSTGFKLRSGYSPQVWATGLMLYGMLAFSFLNKAQKVLPAYFNEALRVLPFLVIYFAGSALGTIFWYTGVSLGNLISPADQQVLRDTQALPWVGATLVAGSILWHRPSFGKKLNLTLLTLLLAHTAFFSFPIIFDLPSNHTFGAIFSIFVWAVAATAAALAHRRRLFDFITVVIIIRLIGVYFEVFGSLMATGIGLVSSGLLVLGIAWVWFKYRGRLATWIGEV